MLVAMEDACFSSAVIVLWEVRRRCGKMIDIWDARTMLSAGSSGSELEGIPSKTLRSFLLVV